MLDKNYDAFLFDMDGTLINSVPAAERVWGAWARAHGLDVEAFLPTIHGVRAIETIRNLNLPGVDPEEEVRKLTAAEFQDVDGIEPIPGAARFLARLPPERWAIVTSAPRHLAFKRMAIAGLPRPDIFVTAEDVERGKPAPDCFVLAATQLGFDAARCLVFEDAIAGIRAAEAAGAEVAVVTTTHRHAMDTRHLMFGCYDKLVVEATGSGLRLARSTR